MLSAQLTEKKRLIEIERRFRKEERERERKKERERCIQEEMLRTCSQKPWVQSLKSFKY